MFERKCRAEGHRFEHSAQKNWGETSNSFRIEIFRFLWGALFPASLFFFFTLWLWLLWFFWGFLFLFLVCFLEVLRINYMYFVTTKRELFGGSFKMLGADIDLGLGIRPLQRCGDQLHQMIHDHPSTFLWIEKRVGEPRVDAPGPLLQVQFRKGWAINALQGQQNITHFCLCVASNSAIGVDVIQSSSKLHPHHLWLIKDIFEGDRGPAPCCY